MDTIKKWTSLPMPNSQEPPVDKTGRRISPESSLLSPRRPNRSGDWTKLDRSNKPLRRLWPKFWYIYFADLFFPFLSVSLCLSLSVCLCLSVCLSLSLRSCLTCLMLWSMPLVLYFALTCSSATEEMKKKRRKKKKREVSSRSTSDVRSRLLLCATLLLTQSFQTGIT